MNEKLKIAIADCVIALGCIVGAVIMGGVLWGERENAKKKTERSK